MRRVVLACLAVLTVAVGCGVVGSADDAASEQTTDTEAATGTSATPVATTVSIRSSSCLCYLYSTSPCMVQFHRLLLPLLIRQKLQRMLRCCCLKNIPVV